MAHIRRWVGAVFLASAVTMLLSACGSQEVKLDTPIKTPVIQASSYQSNAPQQQDTLSLYEFVATEPQTEETEDQSTYKLVKFVASRFKKPEAIIREIVIAAEKYSKPGFPTTTDLLAVIAVESTFNTNAHHKGSWGLMQVEAKSHHDLYRGNLTNIDTNIRVGSEILTQYYGMTHSRTGAIMAYNVGIGSYLNGYRNRTYLRKVEKEKLLLASI